MMSHSTTHRLGPTRADDPLWILIAWQVLYFSDTLYQRTMPRGTQERKPIQSPIEAYQPTNHFASTPLVPGSPRHCSDSVDVHMTWRPVCRGAGTTRNNGNMHQHLGSTPPHGARTHTGDTHPQPRQATQRCAVPCERCGQRPRTMQWLTAHPCMMTRPAHTCFDISCQ